MKVIEARFNEENLSKFLVDIAERLSIDNYDYVKHLRASNRLETLDIIVLLQKSKNIINHLYDALNYRLSQSTKVPAFFRSVDKESFLFPSGFNLHLSDIDKFKTYRHRWNIVAGVCDQVYYSAINNNIKEIDDISFMVVLTENAYYDFGKEFDNFWRGTALKPKQYEE